MKWLKVLINRWFDRHPYTREQPDSEPFLVWHGDPRDKPKPIVVPPEVDRRMRETLTPAVYHKPLRIRLHGGPRDRELTTISQQTRDLGVFPVLDPVGWEDVHEPTPEAILTTTIYRRHPVGWTSDPDDTRQSRRHVYDLWVAEGEEPARHLPCVQEEFDLL